MVGGDSVRRAEAVVAPPWACARCPLRLTVFHRSGYRRTADHGQSGVPRISEAKPRGARVGGRLLTPSITHEREDAHRMAYVVEKAGLHYAVIYEGVEPITGRER